MKIVIVFGKLFIWILIILAILVIIGLLFLNFHKTIGKAPTKISQIDYIKRTDSFYDGKFHNLETNTGVNPGARERIEKNRLPEEKIPVVTLTNIASAKENDFNIIWLGHSTVIIQLGNMNILIDPILTNMASPVSFVGSKRFSELPILPEDLPDIDIVLISHDHYDHLDYKTLMAIDNKVTTYIVPLGVESHLLHWSIDKNKIQNLAWWEETIINDITFILTPALHNSNRNPLKRNSTLWGGFIIKNNNHQLYYTGDTGYQKSFNDIYEKYGAMDLIMADSGQWSAAWPNNHMTPEESLKAAETVHAKWLLPLHWGAFSLSYHAWNATPKRLVEVVKNSTVKLATPLIGEIVSFEKIDNYQSTWWENKKNN